MALFGKKKDDTPAPEPEAAPTEETEASGEDTPEKKGFLRGAWEATKKLGASCKSCHEAHKPE